MLAIKKRKRKAKVTIAKSLTFLTASESSYFNALQYLLASIREIYPEEKIICIDLGLTSEQINKLKLFKVEFQQPEKLLVPKCFREWPLWNKPQYIYQQRNIKGNLVWLDADCILLNRVDLFQKYSPCLFADTAAVIDYGDEERGNNILRNKNNLNRFKNNEYPNAGVLIFNPVKDRKLIKDWYNKTISSAIDSSLLQNFACYDQGILQYILEESNLTDLVLKDTRYNYAVVVDDFIECEFDFLRYCEYLKNQGIKIAHFFTKPQNKRMEFHIETYKAIKAMLKRRFFDFDNNLVAQTFRRTPLGLYGT